MTLITKILHRALPTALLLLITLSGTELYAQISNEQKNQLNQYTQLIKDYKKQGKYREVAYYIYKSGTVYLAGGEQQNAIDRFLESADYYEQIGSYSNKKKIYSNIGILYAEIGQFKNSRKYYSKSLEISRRLNNKHDISAGLMEVATIDLYIKDYTKAQERLEEALKIGNSLNDALLLRTCYRLLAQLYKAYGNKKKSKQYYDNFLTYDKTIKDQEARSRLSNKEEEVKEKEQENVILIDQKKAQEDLYRLLELQKKMAQDSANYALSVYADSVKKAKREKNFVEKEKKLLERENEYQKTKAKKQDLEIENQKLQFYGALIGIILLLILVLGAIIAFMQKRKANKQLEQQKIELEVKSDQINSKNLDLEDAMEQIQYQNKNIMQSINYAQRIQEAMMPKQDLMQTLFKESFIFFKPRDIVSGDFYWFKEVQPKRNGVKNASLPIGKDGGSDTGLDKKFIVSAVDCTGHGVPGAFMSMLGYNLLNDIVGKGVVEPNEILSQLHQGIRTSLNQDATQNRDGMDMALCVIDPENKTMEYSGAQNPLIYIQDGRLYRIRGNKFPVGGFQVEHHNYTKHVIKIDKPTTCYIFSDGFHDQFGGPQGRKFMTKNFRDLLYEIYQMPMEEQKNILELVINEWMGDNEQTDDILIIGFQLDFSESDKTIEKNEPFVKQKLETERNA